MSGYSDWSYSIWCRTSAIAITDGRGTYELLFKDGAIGWERVSGVQADAERPDGG